MNRAINRWKVAFFLLLIIVIMTIMFIFGTIFFSSLNRSEGGVVSETNDEQIITSYFTIHTTKAQLNEYLAKKLDGNYFIKLYDDYGLLQTTISIFSMDIPTEITFVPTTLHDGNLQFAITTIKVGGFRLPEEVVLQYVNEAVDFPNWVELDASRKKILLNVNELQVAEDLFLFIDEFNLKEDEIVIRVISK